MKEARILSRSISEAKAGQKPAPQTVLASVRSRRKHALPGRPEVGYKLNVGGYVMVWDQERQQYVREHRKIMAETLGRPLTRAEEVHHDNEVRHDNSVDNLKLMSSREDHLRHHAKTRARRLDGTFAPRKSGDIE